MNSKDEANIDLHPPDLTEFFEHSLNGFAIANTQGQIITINRTLGKWLTSSQQSVQGKRFSDFLSIGSKIYYETHLWPLLRIQGHFEEVAVELSAGDGLKMPVLINALERRDVNGQPTAIWLTVFKATDRYVFEQNLKAAKASLEISLGDARQVATLREQLIAILGHDLRNPLASVMAGASILSSSVALSDEDTRVAQLVHRSSLRMAELVNNIMDFARTRLGDGIVIDNRPASLTPVLEQVVSELQVMHPKRLIRSAFNLPAMVVCDAPRVEQVVSNLLANALTHGRSNTPIDISAWAAGDSIEITVGNQGNKIPPHLLDKLFEPFTRESHHASQQGLGLGLYIAAQIAKAHNGKIIVTSSDEKTEFIFQFPNL